MELDSRIRWPAEWEMHAGTWLSWPHNAETWPKNLLQAQQEFADLVRMISQAEEVFLLCGESELANAKSILGELKNVEFISIDTNDAWVRDYGPTFVDQQGVQTVIDWTYNAWGGKYPSFENDAAVAWEIAALRNLPVRQVDHIVEGGSIEGNGAGIVMTTKSCLLNQNRNGPNAESELTQLFKENLGAEEVWWLSGGDIAGDDTDGHIDQIARFADQHTILVSSESDSNDPNFATLQLAQRELEQITSAHRQNFNIVELPMPGPILFNNVRLPASYANFYFVNELVVVPQFGDSNDDRAISILQEVIPGEIIGLPCRNLLVGLGSFHCLSQQQPFTQ